MEIFKTLDSKKKKKEDICKQSGIYELTCHTFPKK
jgi:hypothetical protein